MMNKRGEGEGGFTIVNLLIALGVLVLVGWLLWGGFKGFGGGAGNYTPSLLSGVIDNCRAAALNSPTDFCSKLYSISTNGQVLATCEYSLISKALEQTVSCDAASRDGVIKLNCKAQKAFPIKLYFGSDEKEYYDIKKVADCDNLLVSSK